MYASFVDSEFEIFLPTYTGWKWVASCTVHSGSGKIHLEITYTLKLKH